jgi:hypothetical protein
VETSCNYAGFVRRHVEQKGERLHVRVQLAAGTWQKRGRAFRWPKQSDLPGQAQRGPYLGVAAFRKTASLSLKTLLLVHTVNPSNELTSAKSSAASEQLSTRSVPHEQRVCWTTSHIASAAPWARQWNRRDCTCSSKLKYRV